MDIILRNLSNSLKPTLMRLFIFMLLSGMALAQAPVQNVQAAPGDATLILTKTIDGDITTAEVGDTIFYRLRFACSSLTNDCGELVITDVLPTNPNFPFGPLFTYVPADFDVPAGFTMVEAPTGTITITNAPGNPSLLDGSQYDAVIAVRVNYDTRPLPATITNQAVGRILPPGEPLWELPVTATAPPITINGVTADWDLTKTLYSPSINPTVDTDVTYQVQLCPGSTSGNVALTNIQITDTIPANSVFVGASNGGTQLVAGVVTWNVAGPITPPNCVTRYVTVRYPSTLFESVSPPNNPALIENVTNEATYTADYAPSIGTCVSPCLNDTVSINHDIIDIVEGPTYNKNDVGDPVGWVGTARFTLELDTNGTNYPSNAVTLTDTLPAQLQVTGVTSGTWASNHVRATIQYATNYAPTPPNWTAFPGQPVEYNDNDLYNVGLPTNITRLRWVFEYDSDPNDLNGDGNLVPLPGLPYDWTFSNNPEIRVTPRHTATTASDGTTMLAAVVGAFYTNCLQMSHINSGGTPVTGACANEDMTVQGDFVSLRTTKAETPGGSYDPVDDPLINTFVADGSILPNDTLRYVLTVDITERSSANLVNPTIQDTMPPELIFVRNGTAQLDGVDLPPAQQPTFTQAGQTLTWAWNNPSPALTVSPLTLGSHYLTVSFYGYVPRGTPPSPVATPYINNLYVTTDSVDLFCEIAGTHDVDDDDIDGDLNSTEDACKNTDTFRVERSAALRGEKWIRSVNADNSQVVRFDTFATDPACPVGGTAGLAGSANPFTRYPCISQAYPEGALGATQYVSPPPGNPTLDDFEYNVRIFNEGNVPMLRYVLYDILPYSGDRGSGGTLVNTARNSEFRPMLRGPVTFISGTGVVAGNFVIEYSQSTNPCRPEVFDSVNPNTPAGCTDDWTNVAPADWSTVRAYRIELVSGSIQQAVPAGQEPRFGVPMFIPRDSLPLGVFNADDAQSREIAWNSFSHVGAYDRDPDPAIQIQDLLASEPRKVGITIPERFSIGNRVWRDSDNSGTINAPDDANPGIAGVTVNLYADTDGDGTPDGAAIATTLTDIGGYYLFSNLPAGNYVVGIPTSNFDNAADPLYTLHSSTGTPSVATYTNPPEANPDSSDHGIDTVAPPLPSTEVFSRSIPLTHATELTNESDLSDNDLDGPAGTRRGLNGERDDNSDLTVDFGFFGGSDVPFSIGNHLWYDNGTGGGTINDGIRQAGELAVVGARVELYRDGNGNGSADPQEYIRFDVTDAGGFYLFDNLDPGTYYALVVPGNFTNSFDPDGAGPLPATAGVLRGWYSSQVTGTENIGVAGNTNLPATDSDDNGIDTDIPELNGVFSSAIVLIRGVDETLNETHLSTNASMASGFNPTAGDGTGHIGRFGETDATSNMTIDFGFIPPMSLGNRVWFDSGSTATGILSSQFNNGIMDGNEAGVPGVRVELWRGGAFIRATTTDLTGYYLFQNLQPGNNYYIHISDDNFGVAAGTDLVATDPLLNYLSSTDRTPPADNTTDVNDNGIDNAAPLTNGIVSQVIAMAYTTEPLTPANETDINNSGTYGPSNVGTLGQSDASSNLTMDFGFILPPRSLGNRLWFDVDNDRVLDVGELPVQNARVSLYRDSDNNGQPDDLGVIGNATDNWLAWDTTDANGYYLFDNLPPARYLIGVDYVNFQTGNVLDEYTSSTGNVNNATNNLDSRDNGVDRVLPGDAAVSAYGVITQNINLLATPLVGLPTLETGSGNTVLTFGNNPTAGDGPLSRGRFGETDANSDLTIDFGFFKPMSLGNRVFHDNGVGANLNNGIMDAGELPFANVRVELYRDTNNNGVLNIGAGDTLINFDVTDANGYYLFDGLTAGNYFAYIPSGNFAAAFDPDGAGPLPTAQGALRGWYNSTPTGAEGTGVVGNPYTPNTDRDDNGVNNAHPNVNGISSGLVALVLDTEPTGETELSGDTTNPGAPTNDDFNPTRWDGPNSRGRWNESDDNSNLTIDFGFIPPLSLGNRVWIDNGSTATGTVFSQFNDGIMNGTELGRANVALNLYFDANNDGDYLDTVDGVAETAVYRTTTTDANGYYIFDGLPLGRFAVQVAPSNFGATNALDGYYSSLGSFDTENVDVNDNGVDSPTYLVDGIRSINFVLDYNTEPSGEIVSGNPVHGPSGWGNFGEVDNSSNLTLDFGFILPHSIGNRVWRDSDNSGTINAPDDANPGIGGVTVNLYAGVDAGGDGIPDNLTVLATTTTNADGFYLFDNLPDGNFIVGIPAGNFTAGQPLESLRSSTGTPSAATYTTPADANPDQADHGRDPATVGNAVYSPIIPLASNEQAGETDLPANTPANQTAYGPNLRGRFGETDLNSDLTVDFGFFGGTDVPFSIGNHVWYDDGTGGGVLNDGIRQPGELPAENVLVYLYRDGNGNNTPDAGERLLNRSDITDANGFYLFDNLDPGTYFVQVDSSNFDNAGDPLAGWFSSQPTGTEALGVNGGATTADLDSDDNGINTDTPEIRGVFSGAVVLTRDPLFPEPAGETHLSGEADPGLPLNDDFNPTGWDGPVPGSRGRFGETDITSNLTIDFGFIPPMSLGNRVWFDSGSTAAGVLPSQFNNGVMDGTEAGVAGVRVELWRDGTFIRATTTDATGYYLFQYLQPGNNYYIHIPDDNFGNVGVGDLVAGDPLLNYLSSTDRTPPADNTTDVNDNGIDNAAPLTNGIISQVIAMAYATEPTTPPETDISPNTATYGTGNVGTLGQTDSSSNLTMDFGFVRPPSSLGNRLWFDDNNNGILDVGELPVQNARVSLYLDNNSDGQPDDLGATDWVAWDSTDANGYYLFDNLPAGRYLVGVDYTNFQAGNVLDEYTSSTGNVANATNNTDSLDNGLDRLLPGDAIASPYGVLSTTIDLTAVPLVGIPTAETVSGNTVTAFGNNPTAGDGAASIGRFGETDANSDLTIDFGFFKPMSLGNRVWRDDGTGGGTMNNGVMDAGELPFANVRVELYRDTNNNGVLNIGAGDTLVNFDLTDVNGYYLFDSLAPGNYFVHIPASNFTGAGMLTGWYNSVPTFANDVDVNDNGVNNFHPETNGISSEMTVLARDTEPTGETQLSGQADPGAPTNDDFSPTGWDGTNSRGRWNESDDNSNLTVDFGFIPPLSLGNRVWLDNGSTASGLVLSQFDDGIMNAGSTEPGVNGATLNLYFDANNDGDYLDNVGGVNEALPYATTLTDLNGYYLFDRLPPGRFYVQVAPSNFGAGNPLDGFITSTGSFNTENEDVNDNGVDDAAYAANGIRSIDFILNHGGEPLTAPGVPAVETDINTTGTYGPNNVGNFGQTDADSNLTLDFGFISLPHSIGNRLWFDIGDGTPATLANYNNGILDAATEAPVVGARVSLYSDNNNDGQPDDINVAGNLTDNWLAWDTTDAAGFYLFDNLPAGRYLVGVDNTNFQALQVLDQYASSTTTVDNATNDTDSLDNGVDRILPDDATASPYGILSTSINLAIASPVGEANLSTDTGVAGGNNPTADDGPLSRGRNGELDANSDLTIDFGFYIPMSIGNRVFRDDGTGVGGVLNDGIMNGGELPIANVRVELYLDDDGTPGLNIATDTSIGHDVTDAGGYYLFDGLTPGNYFVHIPLANFTGAGALLGLNNSTPTGTELAGVALNPYTPNTDRDDNGVNNARPDLNGISSGEIVLALTLEPDNEAELSNEADTLAPTNASFDPTGWDGPVPGSRGRFGESNNNSNLTVDFGFLPVYSLGNRVWYDTGGTTGLPSNGILDGDEAGINNITVNLYLDADNNGIPDGGIIATDITDADGYYRFDNLIAGTYIVEVVPPAGYGSTVDTNQDPDNNIDNEDNGVITLPTGQVRSHPITLGDAPEPTGETPAPNPAADGEAPDNQSNRTVDFGFIQAVAIGNVVWFDTGAGANYNNGIFDAGELGVNGVTVNLYYDANNDGNFTGTEATTPYRTTTTAFNAAAAADGYYEFDQLIPGRYYVQIPNTEFLGAEQLVGYTSSTDSIPATADQTLDDDTDENGRDVTSAILTTSGIRTIEYVLATGTMPVATDDETSYTGALPDNSVNFTADFGFTQAVAIGNRVWFDTGVGAGGIANNGIQDGTEAGVEDVTVELYRAGDVPGTDVPVATALTDVNGDYVFDGLMPDDYFVHIPNTEFQAGGDLFGYSSSDGQGTDETSDQTADENGSDSEPSVNGVSSPVYSLTLNGETITDDQTGYPGVLDNDDVNYTADFGFTQLVAIGDVVWYDTGVGANYNNGVLDVGELGVDGVTVQLYTSAGVFVDDTITAGGGYYEFDNLIPGNYYVQIPNTEFLGVEQLAGYTSSTGSGADATLDDDADENGQDSNTLRVDGIHTMVYILTPGALPTLTDDETSYNGELDDYNVNFTADFGFVEAYSLGNRVWFDDDGDGVRDDGIEPGLVNVTVNLYRDSNNDGTPDGEIIATDLTDANGYYLFNNLVADTYIVEVVPPIGYASTIDAGDPDVDTGDDDDNGVVFVGSNIRSQPVTLGTGSVEPTGDDNPALNPDTANDEAPDNRSNRTVDFGFIVDVTSSEKELTATTIMDNGPTPGTDFTTTPDVAIGEILTYQIRLNIPSGATLTNLVALDQLDTGLAFVDCDSITVSDPGLTGGFAAACNPDTNPTVAPQTGGYNDANQIEFSLGNVTNGTADTQTLTITYRVIVLDIPGNVDGISGLNNRVIWTWGGGSQLPTQANPVRIVEPDLSINKSATPRLAPYGTTIRFTIDIAHTSASSTDAFDVVITDQIPAGLTVDPATITVTGTASTPGNFTSNFDAATNILTVTWDVFPLGTDGRVTFDAVFVGPAPVVNSASVAWTSLPIDPQPSRLPVALSDFNDYSTERWYDPTDTIGLNPYVVDDAVTISLPRAEPEEDSPMGLPATGFAPNVVTELPPMPEGFTYAQTDIVLEIPKLKQTIQITGVPYDNEKREWNLTWLNTEAGWLENTAFPTHNGNSALTAHTTLPNGQPGPFAKLGTLSYGDQVIIHLDGQKYIFEVQDNKQVKPNEVKSTLKHEEYPWLTLITCKSYNEKTGTYTYRTVVRAVLVKVVDE